MALARTALRVAAIAALNADPVISEMCASRVFDSRIDQLDSKEVVPVIVIYTDGEGGRAWSVNNGGPPFHTTCELILEISMRAQVADTDESGATTIDIATPYTDAELEASLDLVEERAVEVVAAGDTPEARLIRTAVTRRVTEIKSQRYASAETGAKLAVRLVTLIVELKGYEEDLLDPPTGEFATLPDPLRTVCQAMTVGSSGYLTCVALAAKVPATIASGITGVDITYAPVTLDEDGVPLPPDSPGSAPTYDQEIDFQ